MMNLAEHVGESRDVRGSLSVAMTTLWAGPSFYPAFGFHGNPHSFLCRLIPNADLC